MMKTEADNTLRDLHIVQVTTQFHNCFIIHSKYFYARNTLTLILEEFLFTRGIALYSCCPFFRLHVTCEIFRHFLKLAPKPLFQSKIKGDQKNYTHPNKTQFCT